MFPDNSSPVSSSTPFDPKEQLKKMLAGIQETDKQLADLKSRPVPTLSAPVSDELEPTAIDALRGFFQSAMPQQNSQQDFGSKFRDSISPGREFLANLMNGMSAGFGGTKFQSVRDQAFNRYVQEQKLQQDSAELRQRAMQGVASLAQQVHEQKGKDQLARDIEMVKISQTESQQQASIMKMQQTAQKFGLDVTTELAKLQQEKASKPDFSDKFYHDAELQTKSLFERAHRSLDDPKNRADYDQHVSILAHQLRLQDLKDQAANKPAPQPKSPTPVIMATPDQQGGYNTFQVGPNTHLPPGTVGMTGVNSINTPTTLTRSAGEQGEIIGHAGNELIADVLENKQVLGKFSDYWKQAMNGGPIADPTISRLMAEFSSFAALQPKLHGFRGQEAMREFTKIIGGVPKSPEAAVQAIRGIQKTAKIVQDVGHPNSKSQEISSQSEYDKLPDGATYTQNGVAYTKRKK